MILLGHHHGLLAGLVKLRASSRGSGLVEVERALERGLAGHILSLVGLVLMWIARAEQAHT